MHTAPGGTRMPGQRVPPRVRRYVYSHIYGISDMCMWYMYMLCLCVSLWYEYVSICGMCMCCVYVCIWSMCVSDPTPVAPSLLIQPLN